VLPSRNITNALAIATAAFQLAGAAPSQNAEVVGSTAWRAGRLARRGRELQSEILVTLSHNWSSGYGWLTLTVARSVLTACDAGRTDNGSRNSVVAVRRADSCHSALSHVLTPLSRSVTKRSSARVVRVSAYCRLFERQRAIEMRQPVLRCAAGAEWISPCECWHRVWPDNDSRQCVSAETFVPRRACWSRTKTPSP
jgi:hypothetical protein